MKTGIQEIIFQTTQNLIHNDTKREVMNLKIQLESQEKLYKNLLSDKKQPSRQEQKRSTLQPRVGYQNQGMKDLDVNTMNHNKPNIPKPYIHTKKHNNFTSENCIDNIITQESQDTSLGGSKNESNCHNDENEVSQTYYNQSRSDSLNKPNIQNLDKKLRAMEKNFIRAFTPKKPLTKTPLSSNRKQQQSIQTKDVEIEGFQEQSTQETPKNSSQVEEPQLKQQQILQRCETVPNLSEIELSNISSYKMNKLRNFDAEIFNYVQNLKDQNGELKNQIKNSNAFNQEYQPQQSLQTLSRKSSMELNSTKQREIVINRKQKTLLLEQQKLLKKKEAFSEQMARLYQETEKIKNVQKDMQEKIEKFLYFQFHYLEDHHNISNISSIDCSGINHSYQGQGMGMSSSQAVVQNIEEDFIKHLDDTSYENESYREQLVNFLSDIKQIQIPDLNLNDKQLNVK